MENQKLTKEQEAKAAAEKAAAEKAQKAFDAKLAKSKNTDLLKHTKDTYVPEPGTEKNYHARIEVKSFDGASGDRKSKPSLQIFAPKAFLNFENNSANLGYSVDILHDPTGKYPVCGVDKVKAAAAKAAKAKK